MPTIPVSTLIRQYFSAYETKDRQSLEDLLNDHFTFSSPHDPHIGRHAYFERCWPNSQHLKSFRIDKLIESGEEAFVLYECTPMEGKPFSNTEYFRAEGSKISEVRVFYGWLPKGA